MAEKPQTKCIAVHVPIHLLDKLEEYKTKTGKSKNTILVEFIEKGLTTTTQGAK